MKNLKSYSDHNIEEAKNKILKAIESCTDYRQIETIFSMIENFEIIFISEDSNMTSAETAEIMLQLWGSLNKKIEELDVD